MIVLLLVGIIAFNLVTDILKDNAENQIQQTASETIRRVDSQYEQIETLTNQVVTDSFVQGLLIEEVSGDPVTFPQRQAIMQVVNSYQVYSDGIQSFELYLSDFRRLFPLNEVSLTSRMSEEWILQAEEANGRMTWGGPDPLEEDYFVAVKKINLLDSWFSHGGYLVTRIHNNYFELNENASTVENEYRILVDRNNEPIVSNYPDNLKELMLKGEGVVTINGNEYMLVQETSELTDWTLMIYTPVNSLLRGISGLGTAIIISGAVGFLIFLIFSYSLATFLTKPILKLTQAMRFGRLGSLKTSPVISSTVEINELNTTYNQLVETTNHLIKVVYEKELTRSRAELKALQAQINPHFLFNTLDALYWSLEENGEEELADTVVSMSELFRYTIGNLHQNDWVQLQKEVDHIERYMQIMKLRFEDRLDWMIDLPEKYNNILVPKLLIQPLVENAIIHGIGNKLGKGTVRVIVKASDNLDNIRIEVGDDGQGMDSSKLEKVMASIEKGESPNNNKGLALTNVQQRLYLYYQKNSIQKLTIESEINAGTLVKIELPKQGGFIDEFKDDRHRR